MSPDPLAPPGPEDLIQKPKPPDGLPATSPAEVPPLVVHTTTWTDRVSISPLGMAARRGFKTALLLGATSAGIAGIGVMFGAAIVPAFTGAALITAGGSGVMAVNKYISERDVSKGNQPAMDKWIEIILRIIVQAVELLRARKKGG